MTPLAFLHDIQWSDLPDPVKTQTKLCLLDLIGIAAGAHGLPLSQIIRDHAAETFGGPLPMLFDPRHASAAGVALATGMTIDALDGHDGYNPAKGHIGCPLFAGALALAHHPDGTTDPGGAGFLTTIAMGYEFGARAAVAQHETVPDYHTSGSWGAVTVAAAGARLLGLDATATRHALGIAEYHGPRSQMMRCIDHPTMVKDGSGWGAMAGVSASLLAQKGFTGAPAITVEETPDHWQGLGSDWRILAQYFKPYPVCRWAQAPVEAVLHLRRTHGLRAQDVDHIQVHSFHQAIRLATAQPKTTEEAQYSTSFPCAVALVRGDITPRDLHGPALSDPEVLRLSKSLKMQEDAACNAAFPTRRFATVTLHLKDGRHLSSKQMEPRWDHHEPPSATELRAKFHDLADPVLGTDRADQIETALDRLEHTSLAALTDLLFQPVS